MRDSKIKKLTTILDLIDVSFMQNVQDFFAKTMGVALISVSDKKRLTKPSNSSNFCSKYINGSELGFEKCHNCHLHLENEAIKTLRPVSGKCHIGLANFAIPIIIKGQYMATVIGGQIATETLDRKYFEKIAKDLEISDKKLFEEIENINILSPEKIDAIIESLDLVLNSIAAIAYANSQLSELGLNYKVPRNIAMEEWLFLNCDIVKSPLSAREFEVLKLIVLGMNNTEIAKELFISVHTAKAHVSSILEKFSVEDRVQIAVKAVREGFI